MPIRLEEIPDAGRKSETCDSILRSLPSWFGIEQAIADYTSAVASLPFLAAYDIGVPVGFIAIRETSPSASEIHVMAVLESHHRKGIGGRLVDWAKERAASEGKAFLTVKTLAPTHPDPGYAKTRKFYESVGFLPVEELPGLWGPSNPCLLMAMPLGAGGIRPGNSGARPHHIFAHGTCPHEFLGQGASTRKPLAPGIRILPIAESHIGGFHTALDSVAKERKFLAYTEAPPLEKTAEFVKNNIRNGTIQLVAVDGDRVVGWCDIIEYEKPVFSHTGRVGIGVIASHRGKGIGEALLSAALARAREKGLVRIELHVYTDNGRAVDLYRKFGFVIEGRKRRSTLMDGEYLDDYIMAKFLD